MTTFISLFLVAMLLFALWWSEIHEDLTPEEQARADEEQMEAIRRDKR